MREDKRNYIKMKSTPSYLIIATSSFILGYISWVIFLLFGAWLGTINFDHTGISWWFHIISMIFIIGAFAPGVLVPIYALKTTINHFFPNRRNLLNLVSIFVVFGFLVSCTEMWSGQYILPTESLLEPVGRAIDTAARNRQY